MRTIRNLSGVLLARKENDAGILFCESGGERYLSYGQLLASAGGRFICCVSRALGQATLPSCRRKITNGLSFCSGLACSAVLSPCL